MAGKIGDEFFRDMKDRGRRELGGLLYNDSNISQPMYPLHGRYGAKKVAPRSLEEQEVAVDERAKQDEIDRDDPDRDDR
jgi:hypothetical protein